MCACVCMCVCMHARVCVFKTIIILLNSHLHMYVHVLCILASPAAHNTSWTGSVGSQMEVSPSLNGSYHIATRCLLTIKTIMIVLTIRAAIVIVKFVLSPSPKNYTDTKQVKNRKILFYSAYIISLVDFSWIYVLKQPCFTIQLVHF